MIEDKLANLPKSGGVWRDGLAAFLGDELCAWLHIVSRPQPNGPEVDSTDQIRAKVIWNLRRLTQGAISGEKKRQSARFAFNITEHRELRELPEIEDRIAWGRERGLCQAQTTVSIHRRAIVADFARELSVLQPVPPQSEIDTIIAEFRADDAEPLAQQEPGPSTAATARSPLRRLWTAAVSNPLVSGTLAAILATAIVAATTYVFRSDSGLPVGTGLRAEILKITDGSFTWRAAFPASALPAAQEFLRQEPQPGDAEEFLSRELDAGAFVVGGMIVGIVLESSLDAELTIYGVRAVVTPEETPTGAFIIITDAVGGSDYEMAFNLDSAVPVAKEVLPEGGGIGQDFFSLQRIGLRKGEKTGWSMGMGVSRRAYSFTIEVQYEVSGKKYRMIVSRNGAPFRVTPDPCDYQGSASQSKDATDVQYSHIRYNDRSDGDNQWRMVTTDLETSCRSR